MLATKKCFILVKLALVNSHDCSHATAFPLQIKRGSLTILAIRTFLCNISKRFSPTLLLNRTDMLFVIYFKFSKFIPYQLGIFHESVLQCLSFLITLLAFTLYRKQFSDCPFKACFKQICFNLKPQEYMDNNFYVNSVFNFIMRHCHAIFSSNLYKTSNDQFKTLHKILHFSNLWMPFTVCLGLPRWPK